MNELSIVLPAYQEAKNLKTTVLSILSSTARWSSRIELIIVDDGSTDGTGALADELAAQNPHQIRVTHQDNRGIGGALKTGFEKASKDCVLIWPADMPMDPRDIYPFMDAIGKADVIVGCRDSRPGYNGLMKFNSWLFRVTIRLFCGLSLRDVNWIAMYRLQFLRSARLRETGVPMLSEMLLEAYRQGASFLEVDSRMKPRLIGTPSAAKFRVMQNALRGLARLCWRYGRWRNAARPKIGNK